MPSTRSSTVATLIRHIGPCHSQSSISVLSYFTRRRSNQIAFSVALFMLLTKAVFLRKLATCAVGNISFGEGKELPKRGVRAVRPNRHIKPVSSGVFGGRCNELPTL
jgi:hypothetical protein